MTVFAIVVGLWISLLAMACGVLIVPVWVRQRTVRACDRLGHEAAAIIVTGARAKPRTR